MPLEILLILVVGGISAIAVMLHFTGRSTRRVIDADSARQEWLRLFPDDNITGVLLSQDRHSALIETPDARGLLWAFGADTVGRYLNDDSTVHDHKHGLCIRFDDFTAPAARLSLSADERSQWKQLIEAT